MSRSDLWKETRSKVPSLSIALVTWSTEPGLEVEAFIHQVVRKVTGRMIAAKMHCRGLRLARVGCRVASAVDPLDEGHHDEVVDGQAERYRDRDEADDQAGVAQADRFRRRRLEHTGLDLSEGRRVGRVRRRPRLRHRRAVDAGRAVVAKELDRLTDGLEPRDRPLEPVARVADEQAVEREHHLDGDQQPRLCVGARRARVRVEADAGDKGGEEEQDDLGDLVVGAADAAPHVR